MFPIRDNISARRMPFVTYFLIAANVAVFLRMLNMPEERIEEFVHVFGAVPRRLTSPEWAAADGHSSMAVISLLTSMFLHGGWGHLISNMWALWLFGDNVEDRLGHFRYVVFYATCGVLAMLAHILLSAQSTVPAVGASGAIAGVMGAYMLFFPRARMTMLVPVFFYPMFIEVRAVFFIVIWVLTQLWGGAAALLFGTAEVAGVAFWAHVGGFFAGIAMGGLFRPKAGRSGKRRQDRKW